MRSRADDDDQDQPPARPINYLGLTSFALGSFALLLAQVPFIGWLTLPLSGLGLLLGLFGLASSATSEGGIKLPVLGSVVSVLVLLLALVRPAWLGKKPREAVAKLPPATASRAIVPLGALAGEAPVPTDETDWVDARREAVQAGDVRARVTSVVVGPVELKGGEKPRFSPERCLAIGLRVNNVGVARKVEYASWAEPPDRPTATVWDQQGKAYRMKTFGLDSEVLGHTPRGSLPPGKFVEDVLVFEAPPADVESLRLELSAAAFGGTGKLLLRIPRSMIKFRPAGR